MHCDGNLYAVEVSIREKAGLLKEQVYCLFDSLDISIDGVCEKEVPDGSVLWYYTADRKDAARHAGLISRKLSFPARVTFRLVKDAWKRRGGPGSRRFMLNGDIEVFIRSSECPPGTGKVPARAGKTIFLTDDLVFGTGEHPTTVYMSGFIKSVKKSIRSFYDAGCGTGILSLVAACYGVEDIVCQDADPVAVRNAMDNFGNNFEGIARIVYGDINDTCPERRFDMVAANLFSRDLIDLKEKLVSLVNPGKYLAVSGVSAENGGEVRNAFRSAGARKLDEVNGPEWTALLYTVPAV